MSEPSPATGQVLSGLRGAGVCHVHVAREQWDQTERWTHGAQFVQCGPAGGTAEREGNFS